MVVSWGFSTLLAKKGMDIVLSLTHRKGCLQTINQFISLRAETFFFFSHYFSSLFTFCLHLPSTCTPPIPLLPSPLLCSLSHSLTPLLLSSPLLPFSRTCVCSPSIILNTPFPERRCMPATETKRLWYKPGCVGRASYLHIGFNQFVFCSQGEDRGY